MFFGPGIHVALLSAPGFLIIQLAQKFRNKSVIRAARLKQILLRLIKPKFVVKILYTAVMHLSRGQV